MAEEKLEAEITVEWIETTEEPFKPEAATEIFATLTSLEAEQSTLFSPTWTDFYNTRILPPPISYGALPKYEGAKRELIINIETTSTLPWKGRIVTIGALDPNDIQPQALSFIDGNEQDILNEFLDFIEQSPYTDLVGYNVAFDYRFIYAAAQKYRREARHYMELELYDLMQQQEQVKNKFVPGFNKSGTLEQWSTYLFGSKPYAPQKQVFKWIEEGNLDEIENFNADKLTKAYGLWVLNKVVEGSVPGAEVLARPSTEPLQPEAGQPPGTTSASEETIPVSCPNCMQAQTMPKTAKVINCFVCGNPIAHP